MKLIDGTKYLYILALKKINVRNKKMEVTDDNEKPRLKMCILFDLGFGLTRDYKLIVLRKT